MPEELLLLLEQVEKEGSVTNALVYVLPPCPYLTNIHPTFFTAPRVLECPVSHKVQLQLSGPLIRPHPPVLSRSLMVKMAPILPLRRKQGDCPLRLHQRPSLQNLIFQMIP